MFSRSNAYFLPIDFRYFSFQASDLMMFTVPHPNPKYVSVNRLHHVCTMEQSIFVPRYFYKFYRFVKHLGVFYSLS